MGGYDCGQRGARCERSPRTTHIRVNAHDTDSFGERNRCEREDGEDRGGEGACRSGREMLRCTRSVDFWGRTHACTGGAREGTAIRRG